MKTLDISLENIGRIDLLRMAHVARIIDEQLARQGGTSLSIDVSTFTRYAFALYGNSTFNLVRAKSDYREGVATLIKKGAVITDHVQTELNNGNRKRLIEIDVATFQLISSKLYEKSKPLVSSLDYSALPSDSNIYDPSGVTTFALNFDNESGMASYNYNDKQLLKPATIEAYLLNELIAAKGERVNSAIITNGYEELHYDRADKGIYTKTLTNTRDRLNKKLHEAFDIEEPIQYEAEQFWLNTKYC